MKFTWKTVMAVVMNLLGGIGWLYFGVWQILKRPVKKVILAQIAGQLSVLLLLGAFVQGFLYLSLAGGVWCIGYMLSEYFKKDERKR